MSEKTEVKWNSDRIFVCVDYPGIVKNIDKVLETIGGTKTVTKTYNDKSLRLPLKLRPNDLYCKPMYADRTNVARILIKVRRKKQTTSTDEVANISSNGNTPEVKMLGIIDATFKFKCMADYQFLPVTNNPKTNESTSIYQEIVPTKMLSASWISEQAPMFLPSLVFSRMDFSCDYDFRKDCVINPELTEDEKIAAESASRVGHSRRKRCGFAIYKKFDSEELPDGPLEGCLEYMYARGVTKEDSKKINEAFERRPVWSKLALRVHLKIPGSYLTYLLPSVAFYMITGPWRSLWIKYGFDPRKTKEAKVYQMVDLRLKKLGESIPLFSKWRGNMYGGSAKLSAHMLEKASVIHKEDLLDKETVGNSALVEEKSKYSFYDGMLPNRRQSIIQICDIYLDEVRNWVLESDDSEARCTEKDGWFEDGFTVKCRKLLFSRIENALANINDNSQCSEYAMNEGDSQSSEDDIDDE
ncbi:General transcription factor 3C polypeptide 5 [Chamberlinius hualienensis]